MCCPCEAHADFIIEEQCTSIRISYNRNNNKNAITNGKNEPQIASIAYLCVYVYIRWCKGVSLIKFNLLCPPQHFQITNHTSCVTLLLFVFHFFVLLTCFYTFICFCFVHHPLTQPLPRHTIIIVFVCLFTRKNTDVDNISTLHLLL